MIWHNPYIFLEWKYETYIKLTNDTEIEYILIKFKRNKTNKQASFVSRLALHITDSKIPGMYG